MAQSKPEVTKIPLGSGRIYLKEQIGEITDIYAALKETIKDENELARVSGGATLEYKTTFKSFEDDLGTTTRTILTADEATLKGGICTWNGNTLQKVCSTARVTEDEQKKVRIVKIGGTGNYDGKMYLIVFRNIDKEYGDSYVCIVGNNQKGITFTYQKDKECVIDPEFSAQAADSEGTKVFFLEPTVKGGDILAEVKEVKGE